MGKHTTRNLRHILVHITVSLAIALPVTATQAQQVPIAN
jgi:hypothetical protein